MIHLEWKSSWNIIGIWFWERFVVQKGSIEKSIWHCFSVCFTKNLSKDNCFGLSWQNGYIGMDWMLVLLQSRFFWPRMSEDIWIHIRSCDRCTRFKQPQEREQMIPIQTSLSLELIYLDILTIEQGTKTVNDLVITDHFTRSTQAYITPKQTAVVTAKVLWENFLIHYGWPDSIFNWSRKIFWKQPDERIMCIS